MATPDEERAARALVRAHLLRTYANPAWYAALKEQAKAEGFKPAPFVADVDAYVERDWLYYAEIIRDVPFVADAMKEWGIEV